LAQGDGVRRFALRGDQPALASRAGILANDTMRDTTSESARMRSAFDLPLHAANPRVIY
jgi:hypothetical protein